MKSRVQKSLSLIIILALLFHLVACADAAGERVADKVVANYSSSDATVITTSFNPNGDVIYEDNRIENVLEEDILLETQLEEQLLYELVEEENILCENVQIEDIRVEIIRDINQDDGLYCECMYSQQLDYSLIHQYIAEGASLVIAEVSIDLVSCVLDVAFCQWGQLALDAGQIVFTVGTTTLSSVIAYHIAEAKSLAAGNSYEVAMFDALSTAAETYYYCSVAVNSVNTVISLWQTIQGITQFVETVKSIVQIWRNAVTSVDGTITILKTSEGAFSVVFNDGRVALCQFANGTTDLYDISTGKYVCSIVSDGVTPTAIEKTIPSEIYRRGTMKYACSPDTGDIFSVTTNSLGSEERTLIGKIDPGGFVKNECGQIIDRIDFDSGLSLADAYKSVNKLGDDISVDVFGNLVKLSGENIDGIRESEVLTWKNVDGIKTLVDSEANPYGSIYYGQDGFEWIKNDDDRAIGRLTEDGLFDAAWKADLNRTRKAATDAVRDALVRFVQDTNNSDSIIRRYFPDLTVEQIEYIRKYGKVPTDIEIHHDMNVANYPDLAGDFSNLEVMSKDSHLAAHDGDFRNPTSERSVNYVDLVEVLDLVA